MNPVISVVERCNGCQLVSQTLRRCSRCLTVQYCSVVCQKQHWKQHKSECVPCTMNSERNTGRIAIKNVLSNQGFQELIFRLAGKWSREKGHNLACIIFKSQDQSLPDSLQLKDDTHGFVKYDIRMAKSKGQDDHLDKGELKSEFAYFSHITKNFEYMVEQYFRISDYTDIDKFTSVIDKSRLIFSQSDIDIDDYLNSSLEEFNIQLII